MVSESPGARVIQHLYMRGGFARFGPQLITDFVAWFPALFIAGWMRYEFDLTRIAFVPLIVIAAACGILQLVFGFLMVLYQGRYSFGSFEEVRALVSAAVLVVLTGGIVVALTATLYELPRSIVFIAAPIAFILMASMRYIKRLMLERSNQPDQQVPGALIYGAGTFGKHVVGRMQHSDSPFRPVGFIDDDPSLSRVWHQRVRVLGTGEDLARIAGETGAKHLIVAIPLADVQLLNWIADRAEDADLRVHVMPTLTELAQKSNGLGDIRDLRDLSIEDLIGRRPVDTDVKSVAGYLEGKRVLVTGAGGSIGSELCRQIAKYGPAELIMLDRDETGLQSAQLSVSGHGLLDTREVVLADIRDEATLHALFEDRKPDVVFHAAALKHLPMLEQYPSEAWKTNVLGTLNVLRAAAAVNVETFVNISTDKAANPTSVLGHSKRLAEKLTSWFASHEEGRYLSVRFGNVLGSRGSMVPIFTALIEQGGPLTVTHPDITRYFMTVPEACQLVVQAGAIGRPAEVLILDMGEPVRILDVAKRMIKMSGRKIDIVFTGLRPHEKLHEELIGSGETDDRPFHEKITHTPVEGQDPESLDVALWDHYWYTQRSRDWSGSARTAMQTGATAPVEPIAAPIRGKE